MEEKGTSRRRPRLFTKQQLAPHITRRHFSATLLHIRDAECCYQPIYQNRSVAPSHLPFFLSSTRQDRSRSSLFPFRCVARVSLFLRTDVSRSRARRSLITPRLMSLLRLSHPFDTVKWNEDFISNCGLNRLNGSWIWMQDTLLRMCSALVYLRFLSNFITLHFSYITFMLLGERERERERFVVLL